MAPGSGRAYIFPPGPARPPGRTGHRLEGTTIATPSDHARRARRAARAGDYSQAGDFYRLAGNWKKANKMYLQGGHYDLAARLAEEMGDLESASLYFLKAGDLRAAGEIELERDNAEKAAYLFSRGGQHYRAAEIFERMDRIEAAAQQYEKAGFVEKAAELTARTGQHLDAARLYETLIAEQAAGDPDTVRTEQKQSSRKKHHRLCGELYLRGGRPRHAAAHFEKALCMEQAAAAWQEAGQVDRAADIFLRLQQPERASAVLEEAGHDLSSLSPAVRAALLTRQGRHREAAAILEASGSGYAAAESWAKAGEDGRAAELYEKDGDLEQAANHYARADRPGDAARVSEASRDFRGAAELYLRSGQIEEAARVWLRAGEPLRAARLHLDRKEPDPAIRALQTVRSGEPDYPEASYLLGMAFAAQGLHTLAVDKFTASIDGRPVDADTVAAHYALARAHEANRRPREALDAYRRILSFDFSYRDVRSRAGEMEKREAEAAAARAAAPAAPAPPARGERYRLERSLGEGKAGEVFCAVDTELGRRVAVRRLRERPEEAGKAERFLREAAANVRLNHPNIIPTYDTGADAESRFIVTGLAGGTALRRLLDEKVRFEVHRIVEIGRRVLEALDHAHGEGILHRNLRPENIFVTEDDRVEVADFGLAVRLSDFSAGEPAGGGQIRYTPPEVFLREPVSEQSDLYSFGILLYEMAVGRPPFRGCAVGHQQVNEPPPLPGPGERPIPEFLKKVILHCLEKDPAKRPASARRLLAALQLKEVVPGIVVAGRYEVLAEVGRGGMGTVFRARDDELDETVALKFLGADLGADTAARLVQEIKIARKVIHPNVVRLFTLEKWRDRRFIVMEYIDGVPLPRWMERDPVPALADRLRVAVQISSALDAAHRLGIIHRDIKPENILVAGGAAKVLDFGIARPEASGHTITSSGTILGSPMYVSPEQIQGRPVDRRTDLYSLGAVLYFLFTGQEAFRGGNVREILLQHVHGRPRPVREVDPSLPPEISRLIERALEPDPERRIASAAEIARGLEAIAVGTVA